MKKILLIVILMFICIINVNAYTMYDKNNPGSSVGAIGDASSGTFYSNSNNNAILLRLFSSNGTLKDTAYFYLSNNEKSCKGNITAYYCSTKKFDYSKLNGDAIKNDLSCTKTTKYIQYDECIDGTNLGNSWTATSANGSYLQKYFSDNKYKNLKELLKNHFNYDTKVVKGDYVIIEPMIYVRCDNKIYFGTVNSLKAKNVSYSSRITINKNQCPNTDSYNGSTFINIFDRISAAFKNNTTSLCNINSKDNYSGCGFFKYNIDDMYDIESKGNLKIIKTDESGNTITDISANKSPVVFYAFKGKNCRTLGSGDYPNTIVFYAKNRTSTIALTPGTYYVQESSAPSGYTKDTTCRTVTIVANKTTTLTIKNQKNITSCEQEVAKVLDDPYKRIKLYQTPNYEDKKLLLNFDEKDAETICNSNVECVYNGETSCIGGNFYESTFNANNLSCYDSTLEISGKTAYCGLSFQLKSSISNGFLGSVTAGMLLLKSDSKTSFARGTAKRVCYLYEAEKDQSIKYPQNLFDPNKFEEINAGVILDYNDTDSSIWSNVSSNFTRENTEKTTTTTKTIKDCAACANNVCKNAYKAGTAAYENCMSQNESSCQAGSLPCSITKNESGQMYIYKYTFSSEKYKDFYLNPVYSKTLTGETSYSKIDETYKFIAYGIPTKINKNTTPYPIHYNLSIEVKFNDETYSNTCKYEVVPGIVEDNKPKLEFRTISKSNPFAGKDGSGRVTGSNWCNANDCSNENDVVKSIIYNRNDSYNTTGDGPIYKIKLKADDIKYIRKEYGNVPYDEFALDSKGNKIFLSDLGIDRLK